MSALSPDLQQALTQAELWQQQGRWSQAEALLEDMRKQHPQSAEIARACGILAARTGRLALAIERLREACRLHPDSPSLHNELGRLLAGSGASEASLDCFRHACELAPDQLDSRYLLGFTLMRLGRGAEAIEQLRCAHALAPQRNDVLKALADAEFDFGDPADALPLWQRLLALEPGTTGFALRLAETCSRLGRHKQALDTLQACQLRVGADAELSMALAQTQEDVGDREGAERSYREALRLRPGWAMAVGALLELRRGQADPDIIALASELQSGDRLSDAERALVGFGLGKVEDAAGRYAKAFASWRDANAARRRQIGPLDREAMERRVEAVTTVYSAPLFARLRGQGNPDPRPVFVVGMPRSGTTLVEQIIASHPLAAGCGELPDLALLAHGLPLRLGRASAGVHAAEALQADSLNALAQRYLATLDESGHGPAQRVVDKAPLNFFHIGLAALMLPQARVIWCRRDPRDVALSIFSENFSLQSHYATDLADIGFFHRLHEHLMRHWQQQSVLPITEIHYEDLVAEPEAQSRRLIEFLGLPWDPACLQFHASDRAVQTPSRWQVRQPIYRRSLQRWRNYQPWLQPLEQELGLDPVTDRSPEA